MDLTTASTSRLAGYGSSRTNKVRSLQRLAPEELYYDYMITPSLLAYRARKGKGKAQATPPPLIVPSTTTNSLFRDSPEPIRRPSAQLDVLLGLDSLPSSSTSTSSSRSRPGSWLSFDSLGSASTTATSFAGWNDEVACPPPPPVTSRRRRQRKASTSFPKQPCTRVSISLEDAPLHFPPTPTPTAVAMREPPPSQLVQHARKLFGLARAFQEAYVKALLFSVIPPSRSRRRLRREGERALARDVRQFIPPPIRDELESCNCIPLVRFPLPTPHVLVFKPHILPLPSPHKGEVHGVFHDATYRSRTIHSAKYYRVLAACNMFGLRNDVGHTTQGYAWEGIGQSRLRHPAPEPVQPIPVPGAIEIVRGRSRVARSRSPSPPLAQPRFVSYRPRVSQSCLKDIPIYTRPGNPRVRGASLPRHVSAVH